MLKKMKTLAREKINNIGRDWNYGKKKKLQKIQSSKTLAMCDGCYSFYYKNSWHLKKPTYLNEYQEEEIPIFFTQCSACLEQEEALYEKESNLIFG